ncbi:MAG: outer membrane beta-barrel family protein [Muribaculum sp.]|nr:outer membrane beta-barrel family protein [Muribaculum sp.]
MNRDSLLVDVMHPDSTIIFEGLSYNQFTNKWFERQNMILRFYQHGFITQYINIGKPNKRIDYMNIDRLIMPRDLRVNRPKTNQLNEITVTSSKVKMVFRGDTIVYNADAFQLGEGSMLDELVRQLPGVELRKGGQIFVNGRCVESLLLNGKDFFKGNATVALSNLPSYIVSNIKVYEQETLRTRMSSDEKKPMVMDVNLKKEYMSGWIANAEAGYGTDNRYMGRLFAMNYSALSRLTIFGNVNNTNDASTPEEDETWNPNWQEAGIETTHKAGVDYMLSDADEKWEFNPIFTVTRRSTDKSEESYETLFLPSETMNRTSSLTDKTGIYDFELKPNFKYDSKGVSININPQVQHNRVQNDFIYSSMLRSDGIQLNSENRNYHSWQHSWEGNIDFNSSYAVPTTPDYINFDLRANFKDNTGASDGRYFIEYLQQPGSNTGKIYRQVIPQKSWDIVGTIGYYLRSPGRNGTIKSRINYSYGHTYRHDIRNYYDSDETADILPSNREGQLMTLNIDDSYQSTTITNRHTISGFFSNNYKKLYYSINPNVSFLNRNLYYQRFGRDYHIERNNFLPEGSANVSYGIISVDYKFNIPTPSLIDLLDITDSTNPLYIRKGNPDLKTGFIHEFKVSSTGLKSLLHSHTFTYAEIKYTKQDRAITRALIYNPLTGATTSMPQNVNGNWNIKGSIRFGYYLNKKRSLTLYNTTEGIYTNSVDLVDGKRSVVGTFTLEEQLKLDWKIADGLNAAAIGNAKWYHSSSPESTFNRINAVDFDYGISVTATRLPWNMSLTTDITMHSRRGYADSRLNDNHLVWNTHLAKSILRGNLTFAIDGYDILGQLSNVSYEINAQGRTETRYNTLPRYAMLHVIYRLNIQPKKK